MVAYAEVREKRIEFPAVEKMRSILFLQKALREESYESCSFWIDRAVFCGATKKEISWVLRHPSWHMEVEPSRN